MSPSTTPSASPSQSVSGEVNIDDFDQLPPVTLNQSATKTEVPVGYRVVFDLPNPSSWTIAADTAAGILELHVGATLEAIAIGVGESTITFTDGVQSITFNVEVH